MNWYPNYGPPPYNPYPWVQPGCSQVPVPPGLDPLKAMEFMDRVYRRNELKKKKEDEGDKKKKDDKKGPSKLDQGLKIIQWAGVIWLLSPLAILLNHIISQMLTQALK